MATDVPALATNIPCSTSIKNEAFALVVSSGKIMPRNFTMENGLVWVLMFHAAANSSLMCFVVFVFVLVC